MTLAMIFPGQGSQSQGMLADLADAHPEVGECFREAGEILGYDLWQIVQEGPADRLNETTVTQPAMLVAGYAVWRVWKKTGGPEPAQLAGHSLGEYTALVCGGALDFTDAVAVVRRRSELMQGAVPAGEGAMAAVLGLDDDAIIKICDEASTIGIAEPVNFNSPGQVVIAGHAKAVTQAVGYARDHGAKRAIVLPVSVPSHSSLMRDAGEELAQTLANASFRSPSVPVIGAASGVPYGDADDIRRRLAAQVYSPVLWVQTVKTMIDGGAARFVECGPGKVLAGLVKRIDRSVRIDALDSIAGLEKALAAD